MCFLFSRLDVGGLVDQIQEIKESVELPLTHPELFEDIGIKPPKVSTLEIDFKNIDSQMCFVIIRA